MQSSWVLIEECLEMNQRHANQLDPHPLPGSRREQSSVLWVYDLNECHVCWFIRSCRVVRSLCMNQQRIPAPLGLWYLISSSLVSESCRGFKDWQAQSNHPYGPDVFPIAATDKVGTLTQSISTGQDHGSVSVYRPVQTQPLTEKSRAIPTQGLVAVFLCTKIHAGEMCCRWTRRGVSAA